MVLHDCRKCLKIVELRVPAGGSHAAGPQSQTFQEDSLYSDLIRAVKFDRSGCLWRRTYQKKLGRGAMGTVDMKEHLMFHNKV